MPKHMIGRAVLSATPNTAIPKHMIGRAVLSATVFFWLPIAHAFGIVPVAVGRATELPRSPSHAVRNIIDITNSQCPLHRANKMAEACEELRIVVPRNTDTMAESLGHMWVQRYPRSGKFTHFIQRVIPTDSTDARDVFLCCYSVPRNAYNWTNDRLRCDTSKVYQMLLDQRTKVNVVRLRQPLSDANYFTVVHSPREKDLFGFCDFSVLWSDKVCCVIPVLAAIAHTFCFL